jgi:hypothetical protein
MHEAVALVYFGTICQHELLGLENMQQKFARLEYSQKS